MSLLQIITFFNPLVIPKDGVFFPHEKTGRKSTGEAFVFFEDADSAAKAVEKSGQNIGHRCVIFGRVTVVKLV